MSADFLHVAVGLQVGARYVQWNILRIDDAVEERQKVGYDAFHIVCNEHLALVELNLVLLQLHVGLNLGEEQNTREIKGIVHIDVNVEEGIFKGVGVKRLVELVVVFAAQLAGFLRPSGFCFIDDVRLFDGFVLGFFAFCRHIDALFFLPALDGYAHKTRIFLQELLDFELLQKVLALAVDVQDDLGTPVFFRAALQFKLGRPIAGPMRTFFVVT